MNNSNIPKWYSDMFDAYPPLPEEFIPRDELIKAGFNIPDADGSRSTEFRNYAITNNTFDSKALKESLSDIYLNTSHRYVASENDNTHFHRWEGTISDWTHEEHTNWYTLTLPWDIFIYPKQRDIFKISQFYHRWISVTEILNNWDIFQGTIMMFVNQRVASNYDIWIEEQEVTIRTLFATTWRNTDLPVYLYKFDTAFQSRVKVTYRELDDFYKWNYPLVNLSAYNQYFRKDEHMHLILDNQGNPVVEHRKTGDYLEAGVHKLMLTFNQTLDDREKESDRSVNATLGDNVEFITINTNADVIHLGTIHPININYLLSKQHEQFWMTIIAPKFFHEYPTLLATDIIYRPYLPSMEAITVLKQNMPSRVKTDGNASILISDTQVPWRKAIIKEDGNVLMEDKFPLEYKTDINGNYILDEDGNPIPVQVKVYDPYIDSRLHRDIHLKYPHAIIGKPDIRQVYIDRFDHYNDDYNGWLNIVRPIVLSDAFKSYPEPYDEILKQMEQFRTDTANFIHTTDGFPAFIADSISKNDNTWFRALTQLYSAGITVFNDFAAYYDDRKCPRNEKAQLAFDGFFQFVFYLYDTYWGDIWAVPRSFLENINIITAEAFDLINRFDIANVVSKIPRRYLWYQPNEFGNQQRFLRPIDERNFICFEYNHKQQVWRPTARTFSRHFPDVYTMNPMEGETEVSPHGVFKAFFFYSDTMNVREPTADRTKSKPQYDDELMAYHEATAVYKNIFIEKFYWMAITAIYGNLLSTGSRWEVVEYAMSNPSYRRYNELFLNTMDPYFKLGLAAYIKSSSYEFPFDAAISKLQEAMTLQWNDHSKIEHFECYLDHQWVTSYFDYVTSINSEYEFSSRLRYRPPLTFNIRQIRRIIDLILVDVSAVSAECRKLLSHAVNHLTTVEDYKLNVPLVKNLEVGFNAVFNGLTMMLNYIDNLDHEIYSIEEALKLSDWLNGYEHIIRELKLRMNKVADDLTANRVCDHKLIVLKDIQRMIAQRLSPQVQTILSSIRIVNIDALNNQVNKGPFSLEPDTDSVMANLYRLDYPWSETVRTTYVKIYDLTFELNSLYLPLRLLTRDELVRAFEIYKLLLSHLTLLYDQVHEYWTDYNHDTDFRLISSINSSIFLITSYLNHTKAYIDAYDAMLATIDDIHGHIGMLSEKQFSDTELEYRLSIFTGSDELISALSYLRGNPSGSDAMKAFSKILTTVLDWIEYTEIELVIFDNLKRVTTLPGEFIPTMESYQSMVDAAIDYLSTLKLPHLYDIHGPTYTTVYEPNTLLFKTKGYHYDVDETVVIPLIGAISVTTLTAKDNGVSDAVWLPWYRKTFREPTQKTDYTTQSAGYGIGLTVDCDQALVTHIVDDSLISNILEQLQKSMINLSKTVVSPNPFFNLDMANTISILMDIDERWKIIILAYSDNLSSQVKGTIPRIINELVDLKSCCDDLATIRANCDLRILMDQFNQLIVTVDDKDELSQASLVISKANSIYAELQYYFGYGTSYGDRDELNTLLSSVSISLVEFTNFIATLVDSPIKNELNKLVIDTKEIHTNLQNALTALPSYVTPTQSVIQTITDLIDDIDPDNPTRDEWYYIEQSLVAHRGTNYDIGDLVSIVDNGEILLFHVTMTNNGEVMQVRQALIYALEHQAWGYYETTTITGNGTGLSIDLRCFGIQIVPTIKSPSDSSQDQFYARPKMLTPLGGMVGVRAILDLVERSDQFNPTDQVAFRFENIHDLDMKYEVFIGGNQTTEFYQRHENIDHRLYPSKVDVLYFDANMVNGLKNSSITLTADQYFIYKIAGIIIKDPGTGFHEDQDIYLNADEYCLRLKVAKLLFEPFKGIKDIDLVNTQSTYERLDPGGEGLKTVSDDMNNIDDEFHVNNYDLLTATGTLKPVLISSDKYLYREARYPTVINNDTPFNDDRNETFMYPSVNLPIVNVPPIPPSNESGDPEYRWHQGHRIDNSYIGIVDKPWNGIMNTEEVTNPFIADIKRQPPNQPPRGEYQLIQRLKFSQGSSVNNTWDLAVASFSELPRYSDAWPAGTVGKKVLVEMDETNDNHRWLYMIYEISPTGYFRYNSGVIYDASCNEFDINWMKMDWYPDHPNIRQQYPDIPWWNIPNWFDGAELPINQGKYTGNSDYFPTIKNFTTYIHNLTVNDIAVFNWTTKTWENLNDTTRWKLVTRSDADNLDWGFKLQFLQSGSYVYDMKLYLCKTPDTQSRNNQLLRPAILDVISSIVDEVDIPGMRISVNTNKTVRIRKLFPYMYRKTHVVTEYATFFIPDISANPDELPQEGGTTELTAKMIERLGPVDPNESTVDIDGLTIGYITDKKIIFKKPQYMHYRNELHLCDLKLRNLCTGKFENILDANRWEIKFRDDTLIGTHREDKTNIVSISIVNVGRNFIDGNVWGYNTNYDLHVFGIVTADDNGGILTFKPNHFPQLPKEGIIPFRLYQQDIHGTGTSALVYIEFKTENVTVENDQFIHNVSAPMATLPDEVHLIPQFTILDPTAYEVSIELTQRKFPEISHQWNLNYQPSVFDFQCPESRWYVLISDIRFPIINPSTGIRTLKVVEHEDGTTVTFRNLLRPYERLEFRTLPYPIRSVYTQRKIPKHGFIDLKGKLNKPLSKRYYEFWVNGKLLGNEVSIITPSKLIMHGLTSLKNFEIIEVNRDSHEYFSDTFLETIHTDTRPFPHYNFDTYLDSALEGKRLGKDFDRYTEEEQELLLAPVWKQVSKDHPEYRNYPENVDIDRDILLRIYIPEDMPFPDDLPDELYPLVVLDAPTLEGIPLTSKDMTWDLFNFIPIGNHEIINMLNEEWSEEIAKDPYLNEHYVISDDEWYGRTVKLYDQFGILVHDLNASYYNIYDDTILNINTTTKDIQLIPSITLVDLDQID